MPLTPLSIAQAILPHMGVSANFSSTIRPIEEMRGMGCSSGWSEGSMWWRGRFPRILTQKSSVPMQHAEQAYSCAGKTPLPRMKPHFCQS